MVTIQSIIDLLILYAPTFIAIATSALTLFKIFGQFKALKKECVDLKDLEDVKEQMAQVLHENAELKKELRKTLTKIDGIRRDD